MHNVSLITHWLRKVITSLGSTCFDIEVKPVGVTLHKQGLHIHGLHIRGLHTGVRHVERYVVLLTPQSQRLTDNAHKQDGHVAVEAGEGARPRALSHKCEIFPPAPPHSPTISMKRIVTSLCERARWPISRDTVSVVPPRERNSITWRGKI